MLPPDRPGTLVVIGQGYVGLPVAMRAAEVGFDVVGLDTDKHRISQLAAGFSYVADVPDSVLQAALRTGRYAATDSYEALAGFTAAIITVPTPLRDGVPDLSFIVDATRSLGPSVTSGSVVVLESTTYPGTTEELVVPILEQESGLKASRDFYVGYSPERIDPGNPMYGFKNTPKVISGIDDISRSRVERLYQRLVDTTISVSSPREAELTKLLENTFRHVNIALVNELAIYAHQLHIDIWEAIDAASTKPFGYMRFTPGPGVGGHCLPIDPSYLSWQVRRELGRSFRFVELANDINDHMPGYVVHRVTTLLNKKGKPVRGSKVLFVGLSYKKNTGDIRESPSLKVIDLLADLGAIMSAAEPHIEEHRWPRRVSQIELSRDELEWADIAVILADHDEFDLTLFHDCDTPTLDTRHCVAGLAVEAL